MIKSNEMATPGVEPSTRKKWHLHQANSDGAELNSCGGSGWAAAHRRVSQGTGIARGQRERVPRMVQKQAQGAARGTDRFSSIVKLRRRG